MRFLGASQLQPYWNRDSVMDNKERIDAEFFDEPFRFGDITFGRKGRFIFSKMDRTPDEQKILLRKLASQKTEFENDIKKKVNELENILLSHDPLDIISNIFLHNSIHDPETYKEYAYDGNPAYAEYVANLCLTKNLDQFNRNSLKPIDGDILEDIQNRVRNIFEAQIFFFMIKDIDQSQEKFPDILAQLRFFTLGRSLTMRSPEYHHHLVDFLKEIFTPLQSDLERSLGFNIDDALHIAESIELLMVERLRERKKAVDKLQQDVEIALKKLRETNEISEEFDQELLLKLSQLSENDMKEWSKAASVAYVFFGIGHTFSFSSDDLALFAKLDNGHVKAFLEKFSLEFGQVDERYRHPTPTHPLMTKPLIKIDDKYFCPSFMLIYWGLRKAIETFWNPANSESILKDDTIWSRYERTRAKFLEEKTLYYLNIILKQSLSYRKLKYRFQENGQEIEAELDGLLILDSALFIVEVKAGSLSYPALRGAPKRMMAELDELVAKAASQAKRAKDFIEKQAHPTFFLEDGTEVKIAKQDIDRIFMITVTLDNLDTFVTNLYQLQELRLFAQKEIPWCVSLGNLRVISEIIEFSSEFIHYLERRKKLNEDGIAEAHEELDWFGHYLSEGLYFDDICQQEEELRTIRLLTYTTGFDDYYSYISGERNTPVDKPKQPMPEVMREILSELEISRPKGYLQVAYELLDRSGTSRNKFAEIAQSLRKKTREDRSYHEFSLICDKSSCGIAYMFAPSELAIDLQKRLYRYCILKKYQTKMKKWIGLACIADSQHWIYMIAISNAEWKYNEELDLLVQQHLPKY